MIIVFFIFGIIFKFTYRSFFMMKILYLTRFYMPCFIYFWLIMKKRASKVFFTIGFFSLKSLFEYIRSWLRIRLLFLMEFWRMITPIQSFHLIQNFNLLRCKESDISDTLIPIVFFIWKFKRVTKLNFPSYFPRIS